MGRNNTVEPVAFDTETTGVNPWKGDRPFAFAFCWPDGRTDYRELAVNPKTREPKKDKKVTKWLREILLDRSIPKVMHSAKFDTRMMDIAYGFRPRGVIHETMFMAHACNSLEPNYKLKDLSERYCGFPKTDQDKLKSLVRHLRRRAKTAGWSVATEKQVQKDGSIKLKGVVEADYWLPRAAARCLDCGLLSDDEAASCEKYARQDVERTMLLYLLYDKLLDKLGVREIYELEMRLWPINYAMESRGVRLDLEFVEREIVKIKKTIKRLYYDIEKQTWGGFNPDSPKHLCRVLYTDKYLGLECAVFTDKGNQSADKYALSMHSDTPLVGLILKYRSAVKSFGSFFNKYRSLAVPDPLNTGGVVLHPDFRQVGPATGRMACATPNLQNVPSLETSTSDEPIEARTPFGPRPGYVWLHLDYNGMELRVFAFVSGERYMLAAFNAGRNVHTEVCNRVWGGHSTTAIANAAKSLGVTPRQAKRRLLDFEGNIVAAEAAIGKSTSRTRTKNLNFLSIYGGGLPAIMRLNRCSESVGRGIINDYNSRFPRIKQFAYELADQARRDGYITSLWGRRLTVFSDLAYRAVNYLVQGSCADFIKDRLIAVCGYLRRKKLDAHLVMVIHDEAVLEIRRRQCTLGLVKTLCKMMEQHGGRITGVRMVVEPKLVFDCWNNKKKLRGWKYD